MQNLETTSRRIQRQYSLLLTTLLALFCLRVAGQIMVAFFNVGWLPPMSEWQSGLLPYPALLVCQFVIIITFSKICLDLAFARGYFATPHQKLGRVLLVIGAIYLMSMIARYVLWMHLHPELRWLGGSIPIIFHCVLATFLLLLGRYNYTFEHTAEPPNRR